MSSQRPIGLFDSGVGGLTIAQAIAQKFPSESLVYFGDTARFPFGNKTEEAILQMAGENGHFLLSHNIKLLVIPCYTASSIAFETLQKQFPIPIISIATCGLQELAASTKTGSVALLGTTRTIESAVLQNQLLAINPQLQIHPVACPLLAPFVERGLQDDLELSQILDHYLQPLRKTKVDCVLLACTHYPLLMTQIQKALGAAIRVISPISDCIEKIEQQLQQHNLRNLSLKTPMHRFFVSSNPEQFSARARSILTIPIEKIELAQNYTL